jgi:hypothetical protein
MLKFIFLHVCMCVVFTIDLAVVDMFCTVPSSYVLYSLLFKMQLTVKHILQASLFDVCSF